jgi:hypothetical protein
MMRHTKNASDAYTCAGLALEPYKKSHDEKMIGFTADFEVAVYKQHRFLNDTFLDTLRKLPTLSGQQTKLADIISTIEVERKKLWKDLIKGTTLTLIGLLDQTKPGKGDVLDTLVITRAERQKLLDRILQSFPEVKVEGENMNATEPVHNARLYYQFLLRPYRCADE